MIGKNTGILKPHIVWGKQMASFMIYCDKKTTSIADFELDIDIPTQIDANVDLPEEVVVALQERDWEIDWVETSHLISFYGD